MISECHRFCIELMENRESGWNPERYRHCKCGSSAGAKAGHWGDPRRLHGAEDAQVRRPAQVVKVYLLSSYGEMGCFVAKKIIALENKAHFHPQFFNFLPGNCGNVLLEVIKGNLSLICLLQETDTAQKGGFS